jgi:uncharacterized cofD-like protein
MEKVANKARNPKKVVVIGGGTGTFVTLLGLKKYPLKITVIVTMMDSGGSNRIIRDEFGMLPTSGIRQCQVALADVTTENQKILRKLFEYRFDKGVGIAGMTFGNLFMAALTDILGSQVAAIKKTNELLNVKGEIFPVSLNNTHLLATYEDGSKILGEHWIDEAVMSKHDGKLRISNLESIPPATISPQAKNAINKADCIIFSAGDLFTNTIANLIVKGVPDAIIKSKAKKIVVVNLMTKKGETYNYKATDFVSDIEKYLGNKCIDKIIVNNQKIPYEYQKLYKGEEAIPIENDFPKKDNRVIALDLLSSHITKPEKGDTLKRSLIRHDPQKLAKILFKEIINV